MGNKSSWRAYNKSSECMQEVKDGSVNLIVFCPPYNIGTVYGNNMDKVPIDDYCKTMKRVIEESKRILHPDGVFFMDPADSVLMAHGMYVQLAGMFQKMALDEGFHLVERHINFVHTLNGVELPEDKRWQDNYMTRCSAHSNCHQWLVFSKKEKPFSDGKIFYINISGSENHPCPYPDDVCKIILDMYFMPGKKVLEVFMGTANLGCHVLRRGGQYIGYEIDKVIFEYATKQLNLI